MRILFLGYLSLLTTHLHAETQCQDFLKAISVEIRSEMPEVLRAGESYSFEVTYTINDPKAASAFKNVSVWTTMRNRVKGSRYLTFDTDFQLQSFSSLEAGKVMTLRKELNIPGNFLGPYYILPVFRGQLKTGKYCLGLFKTPTLAAHTVGNYASDSDIWPPKILAAMASQKEVKPGSKIRLIFAVKDKNEICTSSLADKGECTYTPKITFVYGDGTKITDLKSKMTQLQSQRFVAEFSVPRDAPLGRISLKNLSVFDIHGNVVSDYVGDEVVVTIIK